MKTSIFLFVIAGSVLISCSSDEPDESNPAIEMNERYIHERSNCDNSGNFEINCTEFVDFIDNSSVDVLIGGGDIVKRLNYRRSGGLVKIENGDCEITFEIQSQSVLFRIEDSEIWKKE